MKKEGFGKKLEREIRRDPLKILCVLYVVGKLQKDLSNQEINFGKYLRRSLR